MPKISFIFSLLTLICFSLFILGGYGCKSQPKTPFSDCSYGAPKPIFSKEWPAVSTQAFRLTAKEGIEQIEFTNGVSLELIQTGCDHITQDFTFSLPLEEIDDQPNFWIAQAIRQLQYLAQVDESLMPFQFWAQAIQNAAPQIKLSAPFTLEGSIQVTIDRIVSVDGAQLLLTLKQ